MKVVKLIGMKCNRKEYESIKHLVGELTENDPKDFKDYTYLCNYKDNTVFMFENRSKLYTFYEKFNKDIFLKACGIETTKVISLTREETETILGYKIKIVK